MRGGKLPAQAAYLETRRCCPGMTFRRTDQSIENLFETFGKDKPPLKKPGIFVPYEGLTLTELLSNAGITQLTANAKKVFVIRENLEKFLHVDIYRLDVRNPVSLITGRKFHLQPSDIVFIPPSKIVQWNRMISLLTPSTDLFKSYNPVIQAGVASTKSSGQHQY